MIRGLAFTAYPVKNMKRARAFYEKALGLKLSKNYENAWVEYHLFNNCFAITTMMGKVKPSTNAGGSVAFEVDDVDALCASLKSNGASIKVKPFDTPGCRLAVVVDTEGNAFNLHKKKKK
jgi:predicted enzyme related to lactoylglutathione lyase